MKRPIPEWRAFRLLQPGPVALVTARYRDKDNLLPVAWAAPVSYDPPRLGIAIAPTHLTYDLIRRSEVFALNFPGRPLAEQVNRAGVLSGRDVDDKLSEVGLTPAEADEIDVPLIEECVAHIECGLVGAFDLGDHVWLVGEVVAATADDEAFDETWLISEDEAKNPLWYLGGSRYASPAEPIELARELESGDA
jgi:flavin reductase (DIM6/NTAB) family NADH-FMN oxidoreductase RutF